MIEHIPDVIVVGDIELLFLGAAGALGAPKITRRILNRRYDTDKVGEEEASEDEEGDGESES